MDLDGVTSGIAIKHLLEQNRIKVVKAVPINYGGTEYAVEKPPQGVLAVMVDFSHAKPTFHI